MFWVDSVTNNKFIKHLVAILFLLISLSIYGYRFGSVSNHIQVIPFISKIINPALFPNDYYVDTFNLFPSAFPYLIAFLAKYLTVEKLFFLFYVIFRYFLFIQFYNLAYFLFRSPKTAFLAMFLAAVSPLVNSKGLLGNDPLIQASFYQSSAVAPFSILCIIMFLKKRYGIAAVILAGIYYIMPLIGNFLLAMFIFAVLNMLIKRNNMVTPRQIYSSLALFLLLILPGFVWLIQIHLAYHYHSSPYFALWLKNWYTKHYFLSFWDIFEWFYTIAAFVFFLIFIKEGYKNCEQKETVRSFTLALFSMWLIAFIFSDCLPVRDIIIMQLFRSDMFFIAFGCIFAAEYIRKLIEKNTLKDAVLAGAVILFLLDYKIPRYYAGVLIILILYNYDEVVKSLLGKVSKSPQKLLFVMRRVCLILLVFISISNFYFFNETMAKTGYFILLILTLLFGEKIILPEKLRYCAITVVILVSLIPGFIDKIGTLSRGDFSNFYPEEIRIERDWKDTQVWARANTPLNSMFIVPVNMHGFRVYSQRPVFVEWTDGAAMHWRAGFEDIWSSRLEMLGYNKQEMLKNPGIFNGMGRYGYRRTKSIASLKYMMVQEPAFRKIKDMFGASYVVELKDKTLSFPLAYKNGSFRIYRIE